MTTGVGVGGAGKGWGAASRFPGSSFRLQAWKGMGGQPVTLQLQKIFLSDPRPHPSPFAHKTQPKNPHPLAPIHPGLLKAI